MAKAEKKSLTVVVAWVVTEFEPDRNRKLREVKVAKAAMWKNRGDEGDVEKAKSWARTETDKEVAVLVYPSSERDPMGRARQDVLKASR